MEANSELEAEQAHVDRAYARLDELRAHTQELLASVLSQGRGGTFQFREERDVIVRTSLARLEQLDVGDQALCFGRIDRLSELAESDGDSGEKVETFHIGRLGVSSEDLEPLVVDWRAPVAEPFYRATGRDPMGLVLRRHLAAAGRRLTGLEDERFARGLDAARGSRAPTPGSEPGADDEIALGREIGGPGALLAAIGSARSGHMRDIISTIQREQDEIIRSPLAGVLVVQGGPGTGKTAVALHRAAYLLYTHRFPLERQGVLVIGPNPLFLRYIEQVLPSLGESGVTLSTANGLVHGLEVRAEEPAQLARLKGDVRMAKFVARALRSRQRPLRRSVQVPYGSVLLRVSPEDSASIVSAARRRPGTHNSRRRFVEQMLVRRLAGQYLKTLDVHLEPQGPARAAEAWVFPEDLTDEQLTASEPLSAGAAPAPNGRSNGFGENGHPGDRSRQDAGSRLDLADFGGQIRSVREFSETVDRIWPRLSAEELLHDLFGARPLISLAGKGLFGTAELASLYRQRSASLSEIPWTEADLALVDEARVLLGPRRARQGNGSVDHEDALRTYGHIVVDEAQDLSPMQLRMISRRSLSGSVTAVGDIAQATGPWAPGSWEQVTAHLPSNRRARTTELTVSYRTPAEVVEVAARVLAEAVPDLDPPTPARHTGVAPRFERAAPAGLASEVARAASELVDQVSPGTTAVLAPSSLVGELAAALDRAGVESSDPRRVGLGAPLSLLPVDLANGLEFDAVVVVEPAAVVEESPQGLRALYMALTRPTRRLAVVHARALPPSLAP